MSKNILKTLYYTLTICLSVILKDVLVLCDQPKFVSQKGHFEFQSARDKNITIRLGGSSSFQINDINVFDSLEKAAEENKPLDENSIQKLPNQVQVLKTDVRRFTNRLRRYENRTASLSMDRVQSLQTRFLTLQTQISGIIRKFLSEACDSAPCKNGGTCYNLYEDYNCECPKAWTGKSCETDIDECLTFAKTDLGCQNNGTCINLPGSYQCNCTNGFLGAHCQNRIGDCSNSRPGELCGKGQCIPANNAQGFECICDAGWRYNNITKLCSDDVNECLESLVPCHTTCINLPGAFACGPCPAGYSGNGLICRDIDECEKDNGGCSLMPKVQCINTEGSYHCGKCPPGWTGDGRYCSQVETYSCESTNICHPLARCEYISNIMVCVCPEGLIGSGYGRNGCRSGSSNPCNEHNCQNGGTCINRHGIAMCLCPQGYEPPTCELKSACSSNPCLNGGTCHSPHNSNETTCTCPLGYFGNRCQTRNAVNAVCGSVISETSGQLARPSGGGLYGPNQSCAWVIRTSLDLVLNVTFNRFDIQFDSTCSKDWLQINDGKSLATPVIGRFCGNELPNGGSILSSHNTLFLWFHTDYSMNAAGFSLNWTSVTPVCGGRFEFDEIDMPSGHGVIKSPGYPGKSPPSRECEWIIKAPFGKRILFRFFEVVMENSANCTRDALLLYDSNDILERICETGVPPPKYSSTNSVKVHFHTDRSRQDSLFHIHYEVVAGTPGCGGLLTEPSGTILFTTGLERCLFLIKQPPGMRISISFSNDFSDEGFAVFTIYDGKTEDDPIISTTTIEAVPGNFTSTGNTLLIKAHVLQLIWSLNENSNTIISRANFKRICGDELRDPSGGTLVSPNYPNPYESNLDCLYSIMGPINSIVHLNITDYDISEYEQGCVDDADFVEISYSLSGPPERHCKGQPRHIVSTSNFLNLAFHSNTNPQKRRGISAEYYFEKIGCGGVMRDTEGSFDLLSAISPTNSYCEWILEAPEAHVISLKLVYRRSGRKCAPDEVDFKIFLNDTGTKDGQLVEGYCGDGKIVDTTLPGNLATIFMKLVPPSVGGAVAYSIDVNYKFIPRSSTCGGNLTLLAGFIQSPNWPAEYPESSDCIWVIHAPLGKKIELIPKNFSLEKSIGVCHDFLEIRNGMSEQSPLIGKFCGTEIPPHIPSFTNHLYLHFHSDYADEYSGFDITFQQTSTGCGGTLTSHSGSIASPHYPELSKGSVQCDWKITVSQGSSINIRITKIGPTANLCSNDVLTIFDGSDSMSKKIPFNCSTNGGDIIESSENVIFVRYVLPDSGASEDQQFYLEYATNCYQTLTSAQGVIESPNFPEPYPNSLRCEWTIEGRKSEIISLTFSHFELEDRDENCGFDKLEVIDKKDEEVLQTYKICRDPVGILKSDGNKFVIKFSSDSTQNGNGFRLEFKRNGCGGYKTDTSAWLASPNYPYSVDVDCEWVIEAPAGTQVVLDVVDVHIEGGDGNCSTNGLIVKNDKSDKRNLLQACGVQTVPSTVLSHGSSMYIRFYSDSRRARKYLKASYRRRTQQCGGVYIRNEGQILSPNYPHNYSTNTYCEWVINVGDVNVHYDLEFSLENHDIADSTNCSNDVIQIYDGLKSDNKSIPFSKESMCRMRGGFHLPYFNVYSVINVIFDSMNKPPGSGFILNYKKAKCGGYLTKEVGTLRAKDNDGHCEWRIFVPEDSRLVVTFTHVECHCDGLNSTECASSRGLTVKYSSKIYTHICEIHPSDLTISTFGDVSFISDRMTYNAKYSLTGTACGGYFTSLRGSLASPFYPETYPSNVECIWNLNAPQGNYLQLNFEEMNISSSENCNRDYLEIREKSMSGRLLGLFCSNELPKDTLQAFEKIWLKFRSAEGSTGKGFKLSWTNAQLNEISGFNGRIISPSIASIKAEKEPFQWRLTVPRDNYISLNFKEYNEGLKLFDGFDTSALPIEIKMSPWQVTSSTNVIYLMTDNQMLDQFILEWKAIPRTPITENLPIATCNETLLLDYKTTIEITSPGYPMGYENDLNCQWIIKSDHPTRHAVVELYEVRLETLDNCFADYLKVSSSNNLFNWHEELKICDSPPKEHRPFAVVHGTPNLKLELRTDGSVNKTGFSAKVSTACGGNLTGSIGRILDKDVTSLTNNFNSQNCTWHIEVGAGRKIQFTFNFPPNMVHNVSNECTNYALIRDGTIDGAPILPPGRICFKNDINGTITTTTNRATVKYILMPRSPFLPLLYEFPMWNLTYREYSQCNGEVRLTSYSKSQIINSPNYPNVPDPHTECVWIIIAPPGESVQVEFISHFDMNVRQCSKEFIEFRDGATEIARLLGKYCMRPGTIRSSGNVLYMRYLTDIAEPRNGFKANVSLSTCGGTFTQLNNLITSVNYPAPGGYPANSICEYVVKVSVYSRINLTFIDIDLPFDAANLNSSDQVRIYQILQADGERVEDESAVIYGNQTSPKAIEVDSNEVLIRFYSFKANSKFRGFKIKYDRILGACFKDVSGDNGLLSLNIPPKNYGMYLLCRWKITVPKGKRVKLDITGMDGMDHNSASYRNFKTTFYNDFQMYSQITMLDLNNITNSASILSSDNKMFVRFSLSYSTSLRRLRFEYSSSELSNCPDDIDNDIGSFSVAGLQSTSNFFCSFDFKLNGAQTMALNISRLVVDRHFQRIPNFALRIRDEKHFETLRILNSNLTDVAFAISPKHGTINILQNDAISVKELEATYKKNPCGGEFRIGQRFEITMPNITIGAEYGSLDCAWQLLTTTNRNGHDFSANFSFTSPCDEEYVTVHAGPSSEHFEIARICQGQALNISRLRSQHIYVFYHTNSYNPNSQMQLVFQRATRCSEKINLEMTSKEYLVFSATDYKNNLECVWDVEANAGFYLQIEFMGRFYIEESTNCTKDYLEIRKFENNDWISLPRYCGRNLPQEINTTSTRLQIVFRSDENNSGDGFSLEIRNTCYAVFNVTNVPQVIKYPHQWSSTRIRITCDYILQSTDPDKYIQVQFKKFNLGYRDRCSMTKFTARKQSVDGYPVDMGPYCKDNAVRELRAKNNISLRYQASLETQGYEIEFYLDICGGDIRKPTWISSMKNEEGDRYANSMDCVWNITAPAGHNIVIRFKYFHLEEHSSCSLDYVSIYRGSQINTDNREAKLCGNLTVNLPNFHITGNSAIVQAVSDTSISAEGFSARIFFTQACDERITLTQANSPVDIARNITVASGEIMNCNIRAMAPPGFRIQVELTQLDLIGQNMSCSRGACEHCEYVEIVDSVQAESVTLGQYCVFRIVKPKLISSFKDVVVQTNFEKPGIHVFTVNLQLVPAECGSQSEYLLEDDGGIEIEPLRGSNGLYLPNTHCIWRITSKFDFEMKFTQFSLQNNSDVTGRCLDYVLVKTSEVNSMAIEHCGNISSYTFKIERNYDGDAVAEIIFHTDEQIESTGFKLTASKTKFCNKTYTHTSGLMIGGILSDQGCLNDIVVPDNYTINIYVPSLYLKDANCSENHFQVIDKKTNLEIYKDCSENYSGRKIYTSTPQVRVDLKIPYYSEPQIFYYASPKATLQGCGGNLETHMGYIMSPNYQEYKNSSVCRWNLITTSPNRIELFFHEFNMGSVCKTDYLNIIETARNGTERIARHYCEQESIQTYTSESNRVSIVSVAASDYDGSGWLVYFKTRSETIRRGRINKL